MYTIKICKQLIYREKEKLEAKKCMYVSYIVVCITKRGCHLYKEAETLLKDKVVIH